MKQLFAFAILLATLSFSCKGEKKSVDKPESTIGDTLPIVSDDETPWLFDSLSVDKKVHIDDDPSKKAMSILVSVLYPKAAPAGVDLPAVQKTIAHIIDPEHKPATIKSAFDNTVREYTDDAHSYGKEWEEEGNQFINFSSYEQEVWTSVLFVSPDLITVSTAKSFFLGGAHGGHSLKQDNISTKDGHLIKEDQLFKSEYKPKLAKLIQNEVTRLNQSANEDDHLSLLVELDEIEPNGNFYFDTKGIIYIYNQYEITPYVQGIVEIHISLDKIKPLINDVYLPIINTIGQGRNIKSNS